MGWLETQMKDLLGEDEGPRLTIGAYIIGNVKNPLSDPEGFIEASEVVDALQLQFSCPTCRSVIGKRPIPAVAVEEVILQLGMGESSEGGGLTQEHLRQANNSFEQYLLF